MTTLEPRVLKAVLHALGDPEDPLEPCRRNAYVGEPPGIDVPGLWDFRCQMKGREPVYQVTKYGRELALKTIMESDDA